MTLLDTPSAAAILDVERFPTANLPKATTPFNGNELVALLQRGNNVYACASEFPFGGLVRSAGVSSLGNTLGLTGLITAGALVLAAINNVTLSQSTDASGATVSISGPTQSVQTQNMVNVTLAGNTDGALALISSGTLTLAGGPNVTLSQAGNAVTISAAAGGGGNFSAGVSTGGNTLGSTGITGTRLVFAGGNSITLSQSTDANGATITVSGATTPSQTQESQTFGMSNLGNTAGTSGVISGPQLRMLLAGGNNITLSQSINGSSATITISAFNQTVQTQNLFALTISSNTAGVGALVSSGTLSLAGGANITLSQNGGNAITIIGPSPSGGAFSAGASNLGNTAGSTGVTGTQLVLVGTRGISLSQSTGANGGTVSIDFTQSVQTQNLVDVTLAGNSTSAGAGFILISSGTMTLAGGNNITLSQNGNAVTISAFTQSAESNTLGISNLGNTAGTSGVISGNQLRLLFAGGNNVTLSQSINGSSATITVSAFNQTVESNTFGISNLGNTAGTSGVISGNQLQMLIVGGNNITASQSINGSSATITLSAFNQTQESQSIGASNLGNTLGTSGVASGAQVRAVIIGTSNITVSQSVNGASATLSLIGQPSFSAGVSTGGNTAGATGVSGTRLVLVGTNNITLSQTTDANGATVSISGGAGGAGMSAGLSNLGNTSGDTGVVTGRLVFAGGNNITLSGSTNGGSMTITVSAPNLGAGAFSGGISNLGNTAGSTGITGTRLVFVGTNNISLSQSTDANGGTVSINHTLPSFSGGVSNLGNTAGSTGITGTRLVLAGTGMLLASQSTDANGGTVSFNESLTNGFWAPFGINVPDVIAFSNGTIRFAPVSVDRYHSATMAEALLSFSMGSTGTITATISVGVGVYTLNGQTLSAASSQTTSFGISYTSTQSRSSYHGGRYVSMAFNMNLTPGIYWVGHWNRSSGGQMTVSGIWAQLPIVPIGAFSGPFGVASGASYQIHPGFGVFSATSNNLRNNVALSDIRGTTVVDLRMPLLQFRSFTT